MKMDITRYMEEYGHQQLSIFSDSEAGLKAFIAIHNTALGPALGGVRIWPYRTEEEAIMDALRLSRGMTYKSAAAGLNLGGGKAVIMASRQDKTEEMMRSFGRCVESLGGKYITTEDVGCDVQDIEWIAYETNHVTGLPIDKGGSGEPHGMTSYGIYQAMKACSSHLWGTDSMSGMTVAMQGFGKVASYLAEYLIREDCNIVVTDINEAARNRAKGMGLAVLDNIESIYDVNCDIFSPCALGGVLNDETIPRLKCKLIAGSANNQLLEDRHAAVLSDMDILYAPDYIINAGGVINIAEEIDKRYDSKVAEVRVGFIYQTVQEILNIAKLKNINTALAADELAKKRLRLAAN